MFSHSWLIIAFPCVMWLADLACSIVIIYISATLRQDALISTQGHLKPFLWAFFSVTIALNLLTTGKPLYSPKREVILTKFSQVSLFGASGSPISKVLPMWRVPLVREARFRARGWRMSSVSFWNLECCIQLLPLGPTCASLLGATRSILCLTW